MWIAVGLVVVCALLVMPGVRVRSGEARPLLVGTGGQWRRMYGRRSLLRLLGATAAAGVLAYSGLDSAVDVLVGKRARTGRGEGVSSVVRYPGERFWFLSWLITGAIDAWWRRGSFSRWGRRNFEAMVVGLPTLWTMQRVLGADRPSSGEDPRWHPMQTDHAASGHTFMAAIPWLNLARSCGRPLPRNAARAGSVLTGWSRMNDRKHYLSQVILGWTIAWNAVDAVDDPGPEATGAAPEQRTEHGEANP
ncbi:phosphatase PAP2 family protein [bacterium]|nr:phosphatase PAP2 family protein [bacterium]PJA76514.1 MAG: hypothetical protein CO151_02545 [bacterium CG_4_9_14_3_um_filter_65_15]